MPIGKLLDHARAWLVDNAPRPIANAVASIGKPQEPKLLDPKIVDAFERLPTEERLAMLRRLGTDERSVLLEKADAKKRDAAIGGGDPKRLAEVWHHDVSVAMDFDWTTFDFDPPGGFSVNTAHGLAVMSKRAYEDFGEDGSDPAKVGLGFQEFARQGFELRFFGKGDGSTQAFLAVKGNNAILVFRGTTATSIQDICTDANAILRDGYGGRVHSGFDDGVNEVWPDIAATLAELQKERGPLGLHVTGHSLGAALATVAAFRLATTPGVEVRSVVPLASPRVFDEAAAGEYQKLLGDRTYRYVNNTDAVSQVPPTQLGYAHVGKLMYFDTFGRLRAEPGERLIEADRAVALFDPEEIGKALGRAKPWEPAMIEGLWDHGPVGYCKHLYINPEVVPYDADDVARAVEQFMSLIPPRTEASVELLKGLAADERERALASLSARTRRDLRGLLQG